MDNKPERLNIFGMTETERKLLEDTLWYEVYSHLGPPPRFQHIGVIFDPTECVPYLKTGARRLIGLHTSCLSGKFGDPQSDIHCIVLGDGVNEYHLALLTFDDLRLTADNLNSIFLEMKLPLYEFSGDHWMKAHIIT